ncbi:MAG: energy-coupling factor ABC transporter permease [Leptospiraceae bacterium]|nr:energy-coupling factor ABC transporter permease [Leptospiraceae bacterium]
MHIPDHYISEPVAGATAVAALAGLTLVGYYHTRRQKSHAVPTARNDRVRLASHDFFNADSRSAAPMKGPERMSRTIFLAALVFVAQMMNFPLADNFSGHLIGATLLVYLCGAFPAMVIMACVLTVQCLLFGDGGLFALGANILNMALIASVPMVLFQRGSAHPIVARLFQTRFGRVLLITVSAILSVQMAAVACALELALSGSWSASAGLGALLASHLPVALLEVLISVAVILLLEAYSQPASNPLMNRRAEGWVSAMMLIALLVLAVLFSSDLPDALEIVLHQLSATAVYTSHALEYHAPFADYQWTLISGWFASTLLVGLLGTVLTGFGATLLLKSLERFAIDRK